MRLAAEGADVIAVDICRQIDTVPYPMATPEDLGQTVKEVEALDRRIFAREAVPHEKKYGYFLTDLHGETYFESVPSSPEVLVLQAVYTVWSNCEQVYVGSGGPRYMGHVGRKPQTA